ncbi:hypothetical protein CNMCM5793_001122 [Aspergillus hiratsukae]|uniref:Aprataxin-like protein n=1 Tax=Aspergillus hiratsukae TaxID=1194566 RepID=A0A8H6Q0N3_9EURO|nr:hypothetical protein CNMCM5793_001122 [Aspergillus hiratsukae]KAF7163817.1 hypothetical protein CNMCM6106_000632 [Aspergillus hiratsukae]
MSGESPILETEHVDAAQAMPSTSQAEKPAKRDACTMLTELLSPKNKQQKYASHTPSKTNIKNRFGGRDGLGAYIEKPESYPSNVVVYYNDDFVVIHDMFPKSSLHLLLLPRDPAKTRLHPFEAFEDPEFLSKVRAETRKLRTLAAAELRRMYGKDSAQDKERQDALNADPPPDLLPQGRDWEKEVMCGIHAHPSMNHLHIHVISVDRYSDRLKHRKHYNSFATPFFVDIEDFPLAKHDARLHPHREGYLRRDFKCWRCGKDFGNRFTELKTHLAKEFNEWKRL